MKRILYLLLLSPLSLFGVNCTVVESVDGVHIRCWAEDDDQGNLTNVLTKSECENLKRDVGELLDDCVDLLRSSSSTVDSIAHDEITPLINDLVTLQSENGAITPPNEHTTNIAHTISLMDTRLMSAYNSLVGTAADLDSKASEVASMKSSLDSYQCSSANCVDTGGGSVSCPCQEEFNNLLRRLADIYGLLTEISVSVASNTAAVVSMSEQVSLIREFVESISDRLNAPDDRMWAELDDIYTSLSSNLSSVVYSSLNLSQIFYELKHLINGDSGDKLKLTTEGVISLYNSLFSMVNAVQNQHNYSAFDDSVRYFSNTVSLLFSTYNNITKLNASYLPPDASYSYLYRSFTNHSYSARQRYQFLGLTSPFGAGITNWFQRMELYQQAALGWFDTPLAVEHFESNQGSVTESGIEHSMEETTNNFSQVSADVGSLTNGVRNFSTKLKEISQSVTIQPYLPTQIRILPEFEIGDRRFSPIDWDTSPQEDTFKFIRTCTTWLWRISFYVFILALVYSICKKVYLFVLYVFHLCQNL